MSQSVSRFDSIQTPNSIRMLLVYRPNWPTTTITTTNLVVEEEEAPRPFCCFLPFLFWFVFFFVFFCFLSIFYFVWFYWMGLCVRTVAIFRPIVLRATLRRTDARWRRRCLCHGRRVRCIRISIEVDIKRKENFDSVASHVCSYQTRWNRYLSSRQRRRVGKESKRNSCSFQPCLPFGQ